VFTVPPADYVGKGTTTTEMAKLDSTSVKADVSIRDVNGRPVGGGWWISRRTPPRSGCVASMITGGTHYKLTKRAYNELIK